MTGGALAAADGLMGRYNSGLNVTKRDVVRAERAWAARKATKILECTRDAHQSFREA